MICVKNLSIRKNYEYEFTGVVEFFVLKTECYRSSVSFTVRLPMEILDRVMVLSDVSAGFHLSMAMVMTFRILHRSNGWKVGCCAVLNAIFRSVSHLHR